MRLGGNVFYHGTDAQEYALLHVKKGYGAALCPDWISLDRPEEVQEFKKVMKSHDIQIAEVGAWCNPLHPDKAEAEANIQFMINRLQLAEELEAATCVNILGTKQTGNWFGADKACYSESFFEEAVAVSQRIIDTVKPTHTKLSFEMMPYCFLDSPQEYLRFLQAVNRKEAGVHLDICNTMNHPRRFYANGTFIKETFALLKEYIVTLHLKDIALRTDSLTVAFEEVLLGTGGMDYVTLMQEIAKLPADTPAILEHLATEAEYDKAAEAVGSFARGAGMKLEGLVWEN
ncbi:MAG: sugar phosphate isomerase/epimerase [Lachnospiraceae bacterium]|nr:sugar phosphate isomerase/epimerase [Lachnospiraceae bacterium]